MAGGRTEGFAPEPSAGFFTGGAAGALAPAAFDGAAGVVGAGGVAGLAVGAGAGAGAAAAAGFGAVVAAGRKVAPCNPGGIADFAVEAGAIAGFGGTAGGGGAGGGIGFGGGALGTTRLTRPGVTLRRVGDGGGAAAARFSVFNTTRLVLLSAGLAAWDTGDFAAVSSAAAGAEL